MIIRVYREVAFSRIAACHGVVSEAVTVRVASLCGVAGHFVFPSNTTHVSETGHLICNCFSPRCADHSLRVSVHEQLSQHARVTVECCSKQSSQSVPVSQYHSPCSWPSIDLTRSMRMTLMLVLYVNALSFRLAFTWSGFLHV